MSRERQGSPAPPASLDLVVLLTLVFVVQLAMQVGFAPGMADPDYQWHLKTGEVILAEGRLLDSDPFSWTFAGQPWVLHEWLFQILVYPLFRVGGEPAVLMMTAATGGLALFVAAKLADRFVGKPLLSCLLTVVFAVRFLGFMAPRPHLFSYLFFGLLLLILWRARYDRRLASLLLIGPLMLIWVNLHGGYFIGLAFLLAFCGTETLRLKAFGGQQDSGLPRRYLASLWGSLALALVASMVNPDGPAHLLYPLQVSSMAATETISEWVTPNFRDPRNVWFLICFLLFIVLTVARRSRPDASELLLPLITVVAGIASARNTPFAVIIMIAYSGRAIGDGALQTLIGVRSGPGGGKAPSRRMQSLLNGLLIVFLAVYSILASYNPTYWARIAELSPRKVLDFIEAQNLQGRMMNDYGLGGILIRELYPERKVFIDGRADLYGDDFILSNFRATTRAEGWRQQVDRWDIDYAIVRRSDAIGKLLFQAPDFALVLEGRRHDIYLRRNGLNSSVIERFEISDPTKGADGMLPESWSGE